MTDNGCDDDALGRARRIELTETADQAHQDVAGQRMSGDGRFLPIVLQRSCTVERISQKGNGRQDPTLGHSWREYLNGRY